MTGSNLTPVMYSNKAVAVGAVSFYVDHFVTGRVSKFTYGTPCATSYKPSNPEHVKREHKSYLDPTGMKVISGCFDVMLSRVCQPLPLISSPRQFYRITGYKGSGGSRNLPQLLLCISRNSKATGFRIDYQVYWCT